MLCVHVCDLCTESVYLSAFIFAHVASSCDFIFFNNVKTWSSFDSIRYCKRHSHNNSKASPELDVSVWFAVSVVCIN